MAVDDGESGRDPALGSGGAGIQWWRAGWVGAPCRGKRNGNGGGQAKTATAGRWWREARQRHPPPWTGSPTTPSSLTTRLECRPHPHGGAAHALLYWWAHHRHGVKAAVCSSISRATASSGSLPRLLLHRATASLCSEPCPSRHATTRHFVHAGCPHHHRAVSSTRRQTKGRWKEREIRERGGERREGERIRSIILFE